MADAQENPSRSAFSETLGRRTIYLLSFSLFMVFSIGSALSVNIAMLIVFRVLTGGASASVQAVGAGTVADIWAPQHRGRAMGVFYMGPLCGPGVAPIIGGALAHALGWRSTLWALVIFGGVMLLLIFFCLPETLKRSGPTPPRTEHQRQRSSAARVAWKFIDPFKTLALLRYPPVLISVFSAATSFSALYVVNISIQAVFETSPYKFSTVSVGLLYLAPTLGSAVASLAGGRWIDLIMIREAKKAGRINATDGKPAYLPEDRMKENIWLAASLYPAAMIWYGWSVDKGLHWIVSCIATAFFGTGCMLVFGVVTTMLTEFTPKKSSSGVAVNNFLRSSLACVAAEVTQPLIDAMGVGWMCTMVALFAWVTGNACILAIKLRGPRWRVEMDKKLNAPQ